MSGTQRIILIAVVLAALSLLLPYFGIHVVTSAPEQTRPAKTAAKQPASNTGVRTVSAVEPKRAAPNARPAVMAEAPEPPYAKPSPDRLSEIEDLLR